MNNQTVLLTVQQSNEADRLSSLAGTSVFELMQQAGHAVTCAITQRWQARATLVLCGPGNNGGDGFVVATELKRLGWPVRLALMGMPDKLLGAAQLSMQQWDGAIEALEECVLGDTELVIDALFGAGLNRALDAVSSHILTCAVQQEIPIVSIDVPSGVMGDTGESLGAVAATLTVTFFRKKPAHLLMPGKQLCGEVVLAEIGISPAVLDSMALQTFENDPAVWQQHLPYFNASAHKFQRGHAFIVGGFPLTGAARLAARSAARIGAGLVTVAAPEQAFSIYATALTSVMVLPFNAKEDVYGLLNDNKLSSFLIGPGAGVNPNTRARALAMLATGRPMVLDADALTVFQTNPAELFQAINGDCVLTPHEGEFKRLFDGQGDKLTRARAAAKRSNAIIILKGNDTVIAAPDGRAIINANAPATLATAGAGDVLAGVVLGLLTQGMDAFYAAAAAVWIHGAAASKFGFGLIADDLPELIPSVLQDLSEIKPRNGS